MAVKICQGPTVFSTSGQGAQHTKRPVTRMTPHPAKRLSSTHIFTCTIHCSPPSLDPSTLPLPLHPCVCSLELLSIPSNSSSLSCSLLHLFHPWDRPVPAFASSLAHVPLHAIRAVVFHHTIVHHCSRPRGACHPAFRSKCQESLGSKV